LSDDKKDLTRIEELGEFIHELSEETSFEESPPDLPADETNFESPFEETPQENSEESQDSFTTENSDFSSSDNFTSSEESEFNTESTFTDSTPFSDQPVDHSNETNHQEDTFGQENFTSPEIEESTPELETKPDSEFETTTSIESDFSSPFTNDDFQEKKEEVIVQEPAKKEEPLAFANTEGMTVNSPAPEDFSEVKRFAESTHFNGMAAEGNPSFSVLISQIKFIEDAEDILRLLKELNLLGDDVEQAQKRLLRGSFLVPRISEYAAILLAHKLRRFDIDLQLGLSDDIHPPKHGEKPETGIVSKNNLYQNQHHHFQFHHPKVELSQVLISTTSSLEGYQIHRYLGIATENQLIDGHLIEEDKSLDIPKAYQDIAHKLKAQALHVNANAIVGITYQLTPLPGDLKNSSSKYRLSCSGNLVWVNKI